MMMMSTMASASARASREVRMSFRVWLNVEVAGLEGHFHLDVAYDGIQIAPSALVDEYHAFLFRADCGYLLEDLSL